MARSEAARQIKLSAAERKQQQHDAEIGVKVVATLQLWYAEAIAPLERRVSELERERAWWRKLLDRVRKHEGEQLGDTRSGYAHVDDTEHA